MCHFISFFVSVEKNKIICGDPESHSNATVHSGIGDWREAEWEIDGKLDIRVNTGEDLSAYLATVLAVAKNRSDLIKLLSPSVDLHGDTYYFNEVGLHRDDGPAIVHASGTIEYWINGKLHRDDGPAVVYVDGTEEYYINGKQVMNIQDSCDERLLEIR